MNKYVSNILLFQPANPDELVLAIKNYVYHIENRLSFVNSFDRREINVAMAASISSYI